MRAARRKERGRWRQSFNAEVRNRMIILRLSWKASARLALIGTGRR
jgi:hypothetical protein